jgi:thiosulfate/3-mercaptopyruvate sulfurtransferase
MNIGYAHPENLVDTDWVAKHLDDPSVRIIEADEDILLYEQGHIPGAINLDWHVDVQDPVQRDFVDRAGFVRLMSRWGISDQSMIVLYGDRNNWYACYSFWLFSMHGHRSLKVMNGGRQKWVDEGRPVDRSTPTLTPTSYIAGSPNLGIRAYREDVVGLLNRDRSGVRDDCGLVDVRSPQEYSGEVLHMAGYPQEGAQRAGHVPGARSIPWATTANPDGTFRTADELRAIYAGTGITPDKDIITYCRIGERSSHTWFVLTQLLGYSRVRNYDGSWTEWGSLVRAPIEKSA